MQECLNLVECQKRWLVVGRRSEIGDNGDERTNVLAVFVDALTGKFGHPCTAALSVAWEEVGIKHTHKSTIFVGYIIHLYIGVIYLRIVIFLKLQTIHLGSKSKHAINHIVELEVGAKHFIVEAIFAVLEFFVIIRVIPRHNLHRLTFQLCSILLEFGNLCLLGIAIRVAKLVEQIINIGRVGCHGVYQVIFGKILEAKQLGKFIAQLGDFRHQFHVAEFAVDALRVICLIKFLAKVAASRVFHKCRIARELKGYQIVTTFVLLAFCICLGSFDGAFGESVEFVIF